MSFAIPPLSLGLSSSATARQDMAGSMFSASAGDWTVNLAGSGASLQGAAGGSSPLLWVALIVGALWLARR